jgi:hypothetical protein
MGVSHGSPSGVNDPTQGPETVHMPHPTLPMAGSAVYGITLLVLALAGLWTAFVIVACIGGPLTAMMYLLAYRSNRGSRAAT